MAVVSARSRPWVAAAAVVGAIALFTVAVWQLNRPFSLPTRLVGYHVGTTEREIVVRSARGYCDTVTDVRAQEDASSVRVTVLAQRQRGSCPAAIVWDEIPISLERPLGGRAVTDQDGVALGVTNE